MFVTGHTLPKSGAKLLNYFGKNNLHPFLNHPIIKRENIIFICSTMLKPEVIIEYCKHYNFDIKDAVFVDDRIDVLRKAETLGITAYHPSSFTE